LDVRVKTGTELSTDSNQLVCNLRLENHQGLHQGFPTWGACTPGAGPDLPIDYIGLSLGPQDPKGPPTNCGTHSVNCRYMII